MNQRIKLLAERAGLKVESWMTNPPKPFQILGSTEQFEKFAQLIVSECIHLCDQVDIVGADECIDNIKEHFEVK